MTDFIGIIDLTVRHSSMNPLGYINIHEASVRFEQLILYACADVLGRYELDNPRVEKMVKRGIVTQSGAAKLFQFEYADDAMAFVTYLRSLLIEKRLPFKICLTSGTLGGPSLSDIWSSEVTMVSNAQSDNAHPEVRKKLLNQFGNSNPKLIECQFKAYKVPGFHEDEISLALDLDAFKGFGIWIDRKLSTGPNALNDERLFRNFHPGNTNFSKSRLPSAEFFDVRFAVDEDDLVTRRSSKPTFLPTGQQVRIAGVIDLLRRSLKAGDENAVYYVSLLTTIVRSSYFEKMQYLVKAGEIEAGMPALSQGWQEHPPIFHTLLVDLGAKQLFRRVPGLELVLGAVIDEIHAALTEEPPSCGIEAYSRNANADTATKQALADRLNSALNPEGIFALAVKEIEKTYGEQIMRRIWAAPDGVLNAERKRAALKVITER